MKRKAYLRLRERYRRRKKDFVYVDESGFEPAESGGTAGHLGDRRSMDCAQEIPARVPVS